jgi:hypothetical protein
MKAKILAGAVAALMYGTSAVAAGGDCPPSQAKAKAGQGLTLAQAQNEMPVEGDAQQGDSAIIETEPVPDASGAVQDPLLDEGVGGSGDVGQELNKGGSGAAQGEVLLRCEPVNQGVGGSGVIEQPQMQQPQSQAYPQDDATGGSGIATPPPSDFRPSAEAASEPIEPLEVEDREKNDTRGLTLLVGGGVEGYTGELAPQINPGATAGVRAALKPSKVLGLELGYSGALNNIDAVGEGGAVDGPDLIRNGGQAVVTLGLSATDWHPYVLGGIGINDYNFRGGEALGYSDDTVGNVPAGLGFRGHIGDFTVDARANYNFLFDKEFAPGVEAGGGEFGEGGSYQGTVSVGGTF